MNFRAACATLALAVPLAFHSSPMRSAVDESLRGFDQDSQAEELPWEKQVRAIPDAARSGGILAQRTGEVTQVLQKILEGL